MPKTVAEALRVNEQAERPVTETLLDAMKNKEALILLDNCEHVVHACTDLVETLLGSCPRLRILATSREPLSIAGEANRLVPSLSLPEPGRSPTVEELAGYESARLFVERAVSRSSDFALTPENAGMVARRTFWPASVSITVRTVPLSSPWSSTLRLEGLSVSSSGRRAGIS